VTRAPGIALVAALVVAAGALSDCGSSHGPPPKADAGSDAPADGSKDAPACEGDAAMRKANGVPCACNGDCASGACVDGVCCSSACTETCKRCDVAGSVGTCAFVPKHAPPRDPKSCPMADPSTCGLDGTCDGAGACAKHASGVVCQPGVCQGDAVDSIEVCDGQGRCRAGSTTICAPYGCTDATRACATGCTSDADCADGVRCVGGSCGPKRQGAVCSKDSECASGFCTDGYCCNVACHGACVTCDQAGRVGTCWPIDVGQKDPHGVCKDDGAPSCGRTGTCDGVGGCALYPKETMCLAAACAGDRLNGAGTCDGLGRCRPPSVLDCAPYRCVGDACVNRCATDDDCVSPTVCQAGSCGKRPRGQACSAGSECMSGFCVDGVCCDGACDGPCRSCALPSAMGVCMSAPAGAADPRHTCVAQAASTCGTDGLCDGAGACRRYKPGTVCAAEHCESNVFTPESTCDATGHCVAPDAVTCVPFACNGTRCFAQCTADANCTSGNVCTANSCGKKPIGAFCSADGECASSVCAQGVCCATACTGPCKSCALSGTMGQCSNVAKDAPDPTETCTDQGNATCGTTGKCEAGACQKYAQGTACKEGSCPATGTTLTPESVCDGAGQCVTPSAKSCFPFACGVAACDSTCASDADCAPSATCSSGSCGLKPIGAICAAGGECASGTCAQGICCSTDCSGVCMSCAVSGKQGTCSAVPVGGTDPTRTCADAGAASCGTTGLCDGAGACQRYAAGTVCVAGSCPVGTTTATLPRTCDGRGVCKPATTQSCGTYACNGSTCNSACGGDPDCAAGNSCMAGSCGKSRLGQLCVSGAECESGNCVDGVCCSAASCDVCTACNVAGNAGSCQPVPATGADPHDRCLPSPPCGQDGKCNGLGACSFAPSSTTCGSASCSGTTYTALSHCTGAGACAAPATSSCSPYVCGPSACLTTCASDGDCAGGNVCRSGSCTALLPNGSACGAGGDCISTHCVEGVCCGAAACGTCSSCALPGKAGTCTPVPAGGNDPIGGCPATAATTCGTTGTCNGSGQCVRYPAGTPCVPATCSAAATLTSSACDGTGQCVAKSTDCTPFKCDGTTLTCKTGCATNGDCAPGYTCTGTPATCVHK
jgi:hypothetical protein